MRILWSSNAGFSGTGYGNQTKHAVPALKALGHDVAVHAWWGLQGGPAVIDGIQHFPAQLDPYGNDAMPYLCRKWKADLLITLIDLWVLDPALGQLWPAKWVPWFPIDHANPIPPAIAQRFAAAHRLLVYSRYAEREVKAYADGQFANKVRYVPHGIACDIFKPATEDERSAFRRKWYPDWPSDAFVCGMVAANKGYPCRKSFPEAMEAFALFAASHPEARLYLHSLIGREMGGPNLQEMTQHFGIADKVRLCNPRVLLGGDYTEEMMRELYCSFDVLLAPSQGEGFGLPILEAQSCGTSPIVVDHSAMAELVGSGWRTKPLRYMPSLGWGKFAEADVTAVHHALEEAYRRPRSPYWAQIARDFAVQYNWPLITERYWKPFLDEMDTGRREMALDLELARAS